MPRRRWIADLYSPESGHPTIAALIGDQALHLARVLRAQPGQIFDVVAAGFLHRAEITHVDPNPDAPRVDFLLHEELESDTALPLHLLLAIFKFDHFEWAIEKATELGVAQITPILARRTEKHLAQASTKRVERWRRIAHEASQQSRRTSAPNISAPTPLKLALESETALNRILLSETEQTFTLSEALSHPATNSSEPPPLQSHRDGGEVAPPPATPLHPDPRLGHRPGRRLDPGRDVSLHAAPLDPRHPRPSHPPRRNRRDRGHRDHRHLSQLSTAGRSADDNTVTCRQAVDWLLHCITPSSSHCTVLPRMYAPSHPGDLIPWVRCLDAQIDLNRKGPNCVPTFRKTPHST